MIGHSTRCEKLRLPPSEGKLNVEIKNTISHYLGQICDVPAYTCNEIISGKITGTGLANKGGSQKYNLIMHQVVHEDNRETGEGKQ